MVVVVVVFFTLTDRASTIPSNIRGCQSGTWSQRGTKVNGLHHGDNPLLSDHGHFSSYEGHMERRTGKIRGAFSRMHRALDGWMLARAPASPAQGPTTMDLGISIFLIFVRCVVWRNLELLLIKTGWNVFVRFVAENAGRG